MFWIGGLWFREVYGGFVGVSGGFVGVYRRLNGFPRNPSASHSLPISHPSLHFSSPGASSSLGLPSFTSEGPGDGSCAACHMEISRILTLNMVSGRKRNRAQILPDRNRTDLTHGLLNTPPENEWRENHAP